MHHNEIIYAVTPGRKLKERYLGNPSGNQVVQREIGGNAMRAAAQ
ncbi:hypothetical protein [Pantoea deleyi]|nr:hypothetical protein [Pantoea deleyi]